MTSKFITRQVSREQGTGRLTGYVKMLKHAASCVCLTDREKDPPSGEHPRDRAPGAEPAFHGPPPCSLRPPARAFLGLDREERQENVQRSPVKMLSLAEDFHCLYKLSFHRRSRPEQHTEETAQARSEGGC